MEKYIMGICNHDVTILFLTEGGETLVLIFFLPQRSMLRSVN